MGAELLKDRAGGQRDDRILVPTRIVAAIVVVILFTAWFALYLHPGETDRRFAWTIASRMTAMLMGAGYGSALRFFIAALVGPRGQSVGLGDIPAPAFNSALPRGAFSAWVPSLHGRPPFPP